MEYKIIVHGGAWDIPSTYHKAHKNGVNKAAKIGLNALRKGLTAMDACIAAVKELENDPTFDAGRGAFLNAKGEIELDAIVMNGLDLSIGAVASIQNVQNPVEVANLIRIKSNHCLLTAQGAMEFATQNNIDLVNPKELLVGRELERYEELLKTGEINTRSFFDKPSKMGTVGAVAIDKNGNIACATSTGGTPNKMAGRVGDSPLPGSGAYANKFAGVSTTGWGESIMKVVLAKTAVDGIEHGKSVKESLQHAIHKLETEVNGLAGLIMIDREGNVDYAYNTPFMARAIATEGEGVVHVGV